MTLTGLALLAYAIAGAGPFDTARVVDSVLIVEPIGITLQIPPAWIGGRDPHAAQPSCGRVGRGAFAERVHVNPAAFSSLLHATGEWDREYSAVMDSIMPFTALAAHLGPEPWGVQGHCYADLQMRVYVTDGGVEDVRARVRGIGLATAKAYFPSAATVSADSAGWHIEHVSWTAWYFDYGGEANVELFMRPFGARLLVLAFMHTSWPAGAAQDRDSILASVHVR